MLIVESRWWMCGCVLKKLPWFFEKCHNQTEDTELSELKMPAGHLWPLRY